MVNPDLEHGIIGEHARSLARWSLFTGNHTNQTSPSISRVSDILRNLSPSCFTPRVVSIGPLHRKNINPEELKASYLSSLLRRIPSDQEDIILKKEEILKPCLQKVYPSLQQIRDCYPQSNQPKEWIPNGQFADIIFVDACFILEFINRISEYDKSYRGNMLSDQTIIYDLVMLENQIPLFILDEIFQCTILKFKPNTTFIEFMQPLLSFLNIFKADIKCDNFSISTTDHILSLLYACYKPRDDRTSGFITSTIHSTVDLDRAGVNFKPNRNPKWMMGLDVELNSFPCFSWCWGKPTLKMPVLHVHDFTELVLRNLIAYEQQSKQTRKYIISYVYAMDMLVNTPEDVSKLQDSRVLVNNMGSAEEAVSMINGICKEVAREHFFYGEEWEKLDEYCNGYWPKNIARLKRNYFNSPWNIIALVAGIILFALTLVQTFYTINPA